MRKSIFLTGDLRRSPFSALLLFVSRIAKLRRMAFNTALHLEGGVFYSLTARDILASFYGVVVGAYSYGECMIPGSLPHGVTVGRYVSMGSGIKIHTRNHPTNWLSMHPFFYNTSLGFAHRDPIPFTTCSIGHDAWIGDGVTVTPGCEEIGIGAVIGTGAVVTSNVPDFAVSVGVPARTVRYRFEPDVCELIRRSKWWNKSPAQCVQFLDAMQQDLSKIYFQHPLLQAGHTEK